MVQQGPPQVSGQEGLCPSCGRDYHFEILEAWSDGTFLFDTCCEGAREDLMIEVAENDPRSRYMRKGWQRVFEAVGLPVRTVGRVGSGLRIDHGLQTVSVSQRVAKDFVRLHHRHNRPPAGDLWRHGVRNGGVLVGVAMVGRPVARLLDPTWQKDHPYRLEHGRGRTVEVVRCCVRSDLEPRELVWNAASQLYGAAIREAKRRGYERAVTYTLADQEAGTTLVAAGWEPVARTDARKKGWDTPSRRRDPSRTPLAAKQRWERALAS